jgi:hypothetical protein
MAYTKYSLTPADNNAAPPDGAPEGMLPSAVNDTMRDMMAQIRDVGDGIRGGTYTMTAPVITGGSVTGIADLAIADGGTGASTAANARVNLGVDNYGMLKNRIINGAMVIDQRNAGASVTPDGSYTLDRWRTFNTQTSKFTVQQNAASVTPPAGFTNYLGVTSSSAFSVGASDYFSIAQAVEGFNTADLGWGTANAKTVTLSFWVRSSLTGTFGGTIVNSAFNRNYIFSYTILSANTWEQKSVTITGDTSGTWLSNSSAGLWALFTFGAGASRVGTAGSWGGTYIPAPTGQTSVVGTDDATFYITGVQLEVGTQATSFEYRQYGTELALCQRYLPLFQGVGGTPLANGMCYVATLADINLPFSVVTRVKPSGVIITSAANFSVLNSGGGGVGASTVVFQSSSIYCGVVRVTTASGLVAGNATTLIENNIACKIEFTGCEL